MYTSEETLLVKTKRHLTVQIRTDAGRIDHFVTPDLDSKDSQSSPDLHLQPHIIWGFGVFNTPLG
mgnify:CR=1 FL=1